MRGSALPYAPDVVHVAAKTELGLLDFYAEVGLAKACMMLAEVCGKMGKVNREMHWDRYAPEAGGVT